MKASLQAPFSSYIIRKLGPEEKVKSFDCGDAGYSLYKWVKNTGEDKDTRPLVIEMN